METVERLLSEEFTDPASTVALDGPVMLARVRRARLRRTAATVAAATLAIVTVGGGALAVRPDSPDRLDLAVPPKAEEPRSLTNVSGLGFAGRDHGYVMLTSCDETSQGGTPGPDAPPATVMTCGERLVRTADGGRTWQEQAVPMAPQTGGTYALPRLTVIGPETLAVSSSKGRWVTRDGGRTWQERPIEPTTTVASVPAGWVMSVNYPSEPNGRSPIVATAPDGTVTRLAPGPTDVRATPGFLAIHPTEVQASNGTRWLPCATSANEGCVLTTSDGGATWQSLQPSPRPAGESMTSWVSTLDGRTVCVGLQGGTGDGVTAVQPIYRSRDAGGSWEQLAVPQLAPATENRLVHGIGGSEVMANGDIILAADGNLYRLAADADAFAPIPRAPRDVQELARSGAWLVAISFGGSTSMSTKKPAMIHLSMDGITWTAAWLP